MNDLNPYEQNPNYRALLNLTTLSSWSADRQREHADDTRAYEAALAEFQAALRSQHVEGDGRWSAARRARKVEKHLKALRDASLKAERAAEGLRLAYAAHVNQMAALPAAREHKNRRQALSDVTAKSLNKTARGLIGGDTAPAPVDEEPGPQFRGIGDLWEQHRGAS